LGWSEIQIRKGTICLLPFAALSPYIHRNASLLVETAHARCAVSFREVSYVSTVYAKRTSFMARAAPTMLRLLLCLCSAFVFCFFQPHTGCGENDEPDFEVLPASQHFILENGLEVVLLENRSSPMVGSLALVKVGSVRESVGTGGLCHLLEHLVFEGTSRRTQREIFREVHSWGGYLNGFTREDYTGYIVMAPPEHLESMRQGPP
jgi:hypothetical protein